MPQPEHPPVEMRIQLLDGFSVTIGERQIRASQFRLRRSRSLIKLLALAPNHRMQRDQVLDLLWPGEDPQTAAHNFYQALFEARRILDPSNTHPQLYLPLHEAVLSLCPDSPLHIDVEDFKTSADRAFRIQDPAAFQAALALYPGDLLPDDRYEDWSNEARETLRQENLRLLLGLAKQLENQKKYDAAIGAFKHALESDALNEEAHAGLMRLYATTGHRQLALRQYRFLAETLDHQLEAQPDPSITHLYQVILSGRHTYTSAETPPEILPGRMIPSPPAHNLPVQMSSFIGREQEKQAVKRLLNGKDDKQLQPARLVTLTGPGGCGKTRLALETAGELLKDYQDGIWLVELAGLSDPDLLPQTLISSLRIRNSSGQPPPSILTDYLKHRQLLLLLDNCEHLVDACARLVETLLKNCPDLQILATSQEILGLPGEVSYLISPLSLPDPLHLLPAELTSHSEAVWLFVERARFAQPGFTLNEHNAPAVAQICRLLDGIPLAIELAAARVRMMKVEEIAAHLERSFDLITGGSRTALPRYQSLNASLEWSYHLLPEAERLLFRRLAGFAGGWSVDAAGFIASDLGDVLDLLTQLVNKSLITPHQTPGEPTRYFYLDTIRRFALDRLRESGEEGLMRDRLLDYCEQLAERLEPLLRGPDQVAWMTSLETEQDNLRAAMEWSLATHKPTPLTGESYQAGNSQTYIEKGLRLAAALNWFWHTLFKRTEAVFWLERLLAGEVQERGAQPLDPSRALARARGLYVAGWFKAGDQSQNYLEESLLIFRELGPEGRRGAAYALNKLATSLERRGDYLQAQALASESLALFREVDDPFGLSDLLSAVLPVLAEDQGDFDQARRYGEEALTISQKNGDTNGIPWAYLRLGEIASREGNYPRAWALMEIALDIYCRLGNKLGNYYVLVQMGKTARAQGDPQHAETIFTEALDLTRQVGDRFHIAVALRNLARASYDQGDFKRASQWYGEALAIGREIEDSRTIARSLRGLAEVSRAALGAGDTSSALRLYKEALQVRGKLVDHREIYRSLEALAELAVDLGRPEQAISLSGAIQELYDSIHFSLSERHRTIHSKTLSHFKSQLGEAAFRSAWEQGQAMRLEQAIEIALSL
jgi:predicted ATPase/DNA-binding SARP family transcriptional activator